MTEGVNDALWVSHTRHETAEGGLLSKQAGTAGQLISGWDPERHCKT